MVRRDNDPKYPLKGFKIVEVDDETAQTLVAPEARKSFFALKAGEKGKSGVIAE